MALAADYATAFAQCMAMAAGSNKMDKMTKRRRGSLASGEDFVAEIRARQRNIVWPAPQVNGRLAGKLLWKGSENATPVQRAGIAIFGLFYLLAGLVFLSFAKGNHSRVGVIFAFLWLLLGARVFRNAFRRPSTGGAPKAKGH